MRRFYCLMIILCPLLNVAQTTKPLAIGDKVPDLLLSTVLNAPYTATSLAASYDKLLLVDFWATWCASCIREFPKLDSLQEIYRGKLQVLLVNNLGSRDDSGKIINFIEKKRLPSGKKLSIPVVMGNRKLADWFPHLTIPHTVWIFKGKLVAVTEAGDVTAAHIEDLVAGRPAAMETKQQLFDFDKDKPLLENGNGGTPSALMFKSLFSRYLPGAGGAVGQVVSPDGVTKRKYYINKPLLSLYYYAYPGIPTNRVILDSALLAEALCDTQNMAWKKAHYYTYEQTIPFEMSLAQSLQMMRSDLDRIFGVSSRMEKRKLPCFVMRLRDAALLNAVPSGTIQNGIRQTDSGYFLLHNVTIGQLAAEINNQSFAKPFYPVVLDETGYTAPVDIKLKLANIHDLPALQRILPAYGLELVPTEREVDMLVITTNNFHQTN